MVKISAAHGAHFCCRVHSLLISVTAIASMVSLWPYRPIFQIPSGWTEPGVSRSRLIPRQARAKPTSCHSQDGGPAQMGALPVMNFDGTEKLDLSEEPQNGDSHVLTLNSTAGRSTKTKLGLIHRGATWLRAALWTTGRKPKRRITPGLNTLESEDMAA